MKTVSVVADRLEPLQGAAKYAWQLAKNLKADVNLYDGSNRYEPRRNKGLVIMSILNPDMEIIERLEDPVLIIPRDFSFEGVRKIAFASDFSKTDVEVVVSLVELASLFDAELIITHVLNRNKDGYQGSSFREEVSKRTIYTKLNYREILNKDVDDGLGQLNDFGRIDIMVLVHRPHGTHTKPLVRSSSIPLLVLPEGLNPAFS